jgi:hypothetical protein
MGSTSGGVRMARSTGPAPAMPAAKQSTATTR